MKAVRRVSSYFQHKLWLHLMKYHWTSQSFSEHLRQADLSVLALRVGTAKLNGNPNHGCYAVPNVENQVSTPNITFRELNSELPARSSPCWWRRGARRPGWGTADTELDTFPTHNAAPSAPSSRRPCHCRCPSSLPSPSMTSCQDLWGEDKIWCDVVNWRTQYVAVFWRHN